VCVSTIISSSIFWLLLLGCYGSIVKTALHCGWGESVGRWWFWGCEILLLVFGWGGCHRWLACMG
jgi:hypothetical protein